MSSHLLLEGVDLGKGLEGTALVEIGSAREPGGQSSSEYLSNKASEVKMKFITIDNDRKSWQLSRDLVGDSAVLSDGRDFLAEFKGQISILYLDNFDFPLSESHFIDICNRAGHNYGGRSWLEMRIECPKIHLQQLLAAWDKLTLESWIIIDDTGRTRLSKRFLSPFVGKGAHVVPYLLKNGFFVAKEDYWGILLARNGEKPNLIRRLLNLYCSRGKTRRLYKIFGCPAPELIG